MQVSVFLDNSPLRESVRVRVSVSTPRRGSVRFWTLSHGTIRVKSMD